MNSAHRATLKEVFTTPVRASIRWKEIESLFRALDAHVEEGRASRVRVELNDVVAVFHRPHPEPTTDKGAVKSVRRFLEAAGVRPE